MTPLCRCGNRGLRRTKPLPKVTQLLRRVWNSGIGPAAVLTLFLGCVPGNKISGMQYIQQILKAVLCEVGEGSWPRVPRAAPPLWRAGQGLSQVPCPHLFCCVSPLMLVPGSLL